MIAMEAGLCSLGDIIKERRSKKEFHSEDEIFIILESQLDGFINLEIHNIAHCDVKPDNLFLFYDQDPEDIFTKLEILEFRSRKKKDFFLSKFQVEPNIIVLLRSKLEILEFRSRKKKIFFY